MCILSKLHYATFGVSNLFFQKLSKKNLWEVGLTPLGTGRVKYRLRYCNLAQKESVIFSTMGLNKSSNKNRTRRGFSILFSVMRSFSGRSLTYFPVFVVLCLKLFDNIDQMSKKHIFLLLLH